MKKFIAAVIFAALVAAFVPALSGCSAAVDYEYKTDSDGNGYYAARVTGSEGMLSGELKIEEVYGEGESAAPVKEIASNGFSATKINKVYIPKTVEKIGSAAFCYCDVLTEVVFAEGSPVTEIPLGAFAQCQALKSINLPEGVTVIRERAFSECSALTKIELPKNLKTIGYEAFYYTGLEEITVPESVADYVVQKPVDGGAYEDVTIPGIGYSAFHSCLNLKTAVVYARVSAIKSGTFGYCPALESVYLPDCIELIEGEAYYESGGFYCGHAFHNDGKLTDVYFAGTEEQWAKVKVVDTTVTNKKMTYDNTAFVNATKHYNAVPTI